MELLLTGAGLVLVAIFFFKSGRRSSQTQVYESTASGLTYNETAEQFEQLYWVVVDQMANPAESQISNAQAKEFIEQIVALKDRMNELEGAEYGAKFRIKYRFSVLKELKEHADRRVDMFGR